MQQQIELLENNNQMGTARNYRQAYHSLSTFRGGKDLSFHQFDDQLIEAYNAYLVKRGLVRNTISFYMRILRSVYNKAAEKCFVKQTYPFRNVYTGIDNTRKRAVDEDVISLLCKLNLQYSPPLQLARDLFLFSYATRGMAFIDMAYLRKKDIHDGVLNYTRHKTGQLMQVRIEADVQQLIDRYAPSGRKSPFLLPILKTEREPECYAQYKVALNYYNRLLKRLSELLGLESGLSSYTSRHSWATAARNHNIPLNVISAGMGHSSEQTTRIYLATLENNVIDDANQSLIDNIFQPIDISDKQFE
ncbi:MAG: site-specific integrase [Prevotellaceae bacterium]|nr:site-specific integrase [Prevotellaceae bacterium]